MNDREAEEIKKAYKDPSFSGALGGLNRFVKYYNEKNGTSITAHQAQQVLSSLPVYQVHLQSKHKFKRRKIIVPGAGINFQADLGFMPDYEGFKYFLLMVDLYSNYIYVEPLKLKTQYSIAQAFEKIWNENDFFKFNSLETDAGQEFLSNRNFFKEKGIFLTIKRGANKSSQAELFIKIFKSALYKYLRSKLSQNWPKAVPKIVQLINHRAQTGSLKGFAPAEVNSPFDDPESRNQLKKTNDNSTGQNKKHTFKVGDFVYKNFLKNALYKGFDTQRGEIFSIRSVDSRHSPYMYELREYDGTPVPGKYYFEELKSAPNPANIEFEIENIIDERKQRGKKQYLVKWLYYPAKYVIEFVKLTALYSHIFFLSDITSGLMKKK